MHDTRLYAVAGLLAFFMVFSGGWAESQTTIGINPTGPTMPPSIGPIPPLGPSINPIVSPTAPSIGPTFGISIGSVTVVINPTAAFQTPAINPGGVVDGASFKQLPAAGSIASLFGVSLATVTDESSFVPLPLVLQGVTVQVNGFAAPLFLVSPFQINFQVPWEAAGQSTVFVTVTDNFVSSSPLVIVGAPGFSPAIFTFNQPGASQGAILIAATGQVAAPLGSVFVRARPAFHGEFVSIYCTGLGPVTHQPASGQPAPLRPLSVTTTPPAVTIGGVPAVVSFSGLAPGFVGLYQVNVQVPPDAPAGDAVEVAITIGGVTSDTVTMAVQ